MSILHTLFTAVMDALHAIEHAALPIMWVMWIYGRLDRLLARTAVYIPALPAREPNYTPADFSIIVPTKETPAIFLQCLRTWVENKPKDIIISTVEEEAENVKKSIDSDEALAGLRAAGYIKVVYASEAGKRPQLMEAYKHTTGRIIAATDDHIQWNETLLQGLSPCFEDAKVGACGVPITMFVPQARRDPTIITGWEVALGRMLHVRNAGLKVAHARGNWCWILAGPLCVCRAEIVKDPKFLEAFANDRWLPFSGKQDVGDDTFLSRWLQKHDWIIAIQDVPGTTIQRTARQDGDFVKQIIRWERSSIQHFLRTLFGVPQIWRNPYVLRKTIERITRPFFTTIHILAWIFTAWNHPRTALAFVAFYICAPLQNYWDFFADYPYMQGHWFAVIASDYLYIIQDYWGWLTVGMTTWEGRKLEKLKPVQGAEVKGANEVRA